jgi:hypothetical protein
MYMTSNSEGGRGRRELTGLIHAGAWAKEESRKQGRQVPASDFFDQKARQLKHELNKVGAHELTVERIAEVLRMGGEQPIAKNRQLNQGLTDAEAA